jgi:hypothetical protein
LIGPPGTSSHDAASGISPAVPGNGTVLLGKPFLFTADNIDQFDF